MRRAWSCTASVFSCDMKSRTVRARWQGQRRRAGLLGSRQVLLLYLSRPPLCAALRGPPLPRARAASRGAAREGT
jgi:hypothetical protein